MLVSACAPTTPVTAPAPRDAAALAARLPGQAAGFARRATLSLPGDGGVEVAYATLGSVAAAATVEIAEPTAATEGPDPATLNELVATATQAAPHRRLTARERVLLPPATPRFACALLDGRLGRERVAQLLCAGKIAGAAVRVRVAMPAREPPVADAAAFILQLATALGAPG